MAESLMETRPDSALRLLESLDAKKLKGESRALYALLMSQALDKNYIDITSDSLISIAVNYYNKSDDERHKMLAYYYMGRVKQNAQHDEESLLYALQSFDIAKNLNDSLNLCRITSFIGSLHRAGHNYEIASEWQMQSLALAKALKKTAFSTPAKCSKSGQKSGKNGG